MLNFDEINENCLYRHHHNDNFIAVAWIFNNVLSSEHGSCWATVPNGKVYSFRIDDICENYNTATLEDMSANAILSADDNFFDTLFRKKFTLDRNKL